MVWLWSSQLKIKIDHTKEAQLFKGENELGNFLQEFRPFDQHLERVEEIETSRSISNS